MKKFLIIIAMLLLIPCSVYCSEIPETEVSYDKRIALLNKLEIISKEESPKEDDITLITRREAFTYACNVRGGIAELRAEYKEFVAQNFSDSFDNLDDFRLLCNCVNYTLLLGRTDSDNQNIADFDSYLTENEMETLLRRINYIDTYDDYILADYSGYVKKTTFLERLYETIHQKYRHYYYAAIDTGYVIDDLICNIPEREDVKQINYNISVDEAGEIARAFVAARYKDETFDVKYILKNEVYENIYNVFLLNSNSNEVRIKISTIDGRIINVNYDMKDV